MWITTEGKRSDLKAIKEFGRIIKSLFILTYYDDIKLRQRIEKQLNRIELSNKFGRAVFGMATARPGNGARGWSG